MCGLREVTLVFQCQRVVTSEGKPSQVFPDSITNLDLRQSKEYTIYFLCSLPLVFPYILVKFFL